MSSRFKPWRKKDNKHFRHKPKKKHSGFKEALLPETAARYELVNGQYVRVR